MKLSYQVNGRARVGELDPIYAHLEAPFPQWAQAAIDQGIEALERHANDGAHAVRPARSADAERIRKAWDEFTKARGRRER